MSILAFQQVLHRNRTHKLAAEKRGCSCVDSSATTFTTAAKVKNPSIPRGSKGERDELAKLTADFKNVALLIECLLLKMKRLLVLGKLISNRQ